MVPRLTASGKLNATSKAKLNTSGKLNNTIKKREQALENHKRQQ